MKQTPFKALAPLLKCKKCKTKTADPDSGLCRECEIDKIVEEGKNGQGYKDLGA